MIAKIIDEYDNLEKKQQDKSLKSKELNEKLRTAVPEQQISWTTPAKKINHLKSWNKNETNKTKNNHCNNSCFYPKGQKCANYELSAALAKALKEL